VEQSTAWAAGVDIGDRKCDICVMNPSGEVVEETQIPTNPIAVQRFFEKTERGRVAMEVGTHSSWIDELVSSLGFEVYVANARKLRAIWDNDDKTDRTDARLLAEIVQVRPGLLRPIKHRGQEARIDLKLVHARVALVEARTKLINHVRGSVKSLGSRMPDCDAAAFHKTVSELPKEVGEILEPVMKQIGDLTALIKGYNKAIENKVKEDPAASLLAQVKGVGDVIALAFVSTVEDPNRFPQTRKIGSYLGLRPRLDKSCTIDKQLRITKSGDKTLRSLLVNSAHYILGPFGPDCDLRRWGLKLTETGGKNAKKRAIVAVARKLSVLLLTLWKKGAPYDPLYQAKRKSPPTSGEAASAPVQGPTEAGRDIASATVTRLTPPSKSAATTRSARTKTTKTDTSRRRNHPARRGTGGDVIQATGNTNANVTCPITTATDRG